MAAGDIIFPNGFDPDRGGNVAIDRRTDIKVCTYEDLPGVFFTMAGEEVPDEVAAGAGFDVAGLRRRGEMERRKREALAEIEKEFSGRVAEIERIELAQTGTPFVPMEIPLQPTGPVKLDSPLIISRSPDGRPRATRYHALHHRGRARWDVVDAKRNSSVIENVDEATAVAFIIDQAEAMEAGAAESP